MIADEPQSLARMRAESQAVATGGKSALFEDIRNNMCRMHLAALPDAPLDIATAHPLFCPQRRFCTAFARAI